MALDPVARLASSQVAARCGFNAQAIYLWWRHLIDIGRDTGHAQRPCELAAARKRVGELEAGSALTAWPRGWRFTAWPRGPWRWGSPTDRSGRTRGMTTIQQSDSGTPGAHSVSGPGRSPG